MTAHKTASRIRDWAYRLLELITGIACIGFIIGGAQFTWQYYGSGLDTTTSSQQVTDFQTKVEHHTVTDKTATLHTPDTSEPPVETAPKEGGVIGYIRIPRLGSDWKRVLQEGVGKQVLDNLGAGHYPDTVMPGGVGNSSFAGHSTWSDFGQLKNIQNGDHIIIQTADHWYVYEATSHQIVSMYQTDVVNPDAAGDKHGLTLTSCWPIMSPTPAKNRYIVHAKLIGWANTADGTLPELAGQHDTTTSKTIRTIRTVSHTTRIPETRLLAVSVLTVWLCLDLIAWLFGWRNAVRRMREPSWNPVVWVWRLQAGVLPVRIVLQLIQLAGIILACWAWVCPWIADTIPVFATPHPVVG